MTDDRLHQASAEAEDERAAEVGWHPPDWDSVLRGRRRRQVAGVAGMVAFVGVVVPLLRLTVLDRPLSPTYWLWVLITIFYVGVAVSSRVTATGRARWEQETRQGVRVAHARRHHVGIGATDRALVIERAKEIDTWSKVAFVGWPLLALLLVMVLREDGDPPALLIVPVVVACLLLVVRAMWRARLARRWLADPLPRDDEGP